MVLLRLQSNTEQSGNTCEWIHGATEPTHCVKIHMEEESHTFQCLNSKRKKIQFVSFLVETTVPAAAATASKVRQLKQATFSVSGRGSSGNTPRTKVFQTAKPRENKQTNRRAVRWQFVFVCVLGGDMWGVLGWWWWWSHSSGYTFYSEPVKAVGLLPVDLDPPGPGCWNKAPAVCAGSGESAWEKAGATSGAIRASRG